MANTDGFEDFLRRRERAAQGFVRGEPAALEAIVAREDPATFFGPRGGHQDGAEHVAALYARDSARFRGGETRLEILHSAASDGLAYWVGIQRATARLDDGGPERPFDLRVTEIFRREGDGWKMIHRHADPMADEGAPPR